MPEITNPSTGGGGGGGGGITSFQGRSTPAAVLTQADVEGVAPRAQFVAFSASGLVVITGVTQVQAALALVDAALVTNAAAAAAAQTTAIGAQTTAIGAQTTAIGAQTTAIGAAALAGTSLQSFQGRGATAAVLTQADVEGVGARASHIAVTPTGLLVVTGTDAQTAIAQLDAAVAVAGATGELASVTNNTGTTTLLTTSAAGLGADTPIPNLTFTVAATTRPVWLWAEVFCYQGPSPGTTGVAYLRVVETTSPAYSGGNITATLDEVFLPSAPASGPGNQNQFAMRGAYRLGPFSGASRSFEIVGAVSGTNAGGTNVTVLNGSVAGKDSRALAEAK